MTLTTTECCLHFYILEGLYHESKESTTSVTLFVASLYPPVNWAVARSANTDVATADVTNVGKAITFHLMSQNNVYAVP